MFLQNKELHIGSFNYVANHKSYSYQYAIEIFTIYIQKMATPD